EADERFVFGDDDATGGGCRGLIVLILLGRPSILEQGGWAPAVSSNAGRCGGMADATGSHAVAREGVWVRLPPPAPHGAYAPKYWFPSALLLIASYSPWVIVPASRSAWARAMSSAGLEEAAGRYASSSGTEARARCSRSAIPLPLTIT